MQKSTQKLKKFVGLMIGASILSIAGTTPLWAQDAAEGYLAKIEQHTNDILTKVNELPVILRNLSDLALSWLAPDTSDVTANLQQTFSQFGTSVNDDILKQKTLQTTLQKELFPAGVTPPSNTNDLVYSTLLGSPYFSKDPRESGQIRINAPYNYFKNAAAFTMPHTMPGHWSGSPDDQVKYMAYFNTITAVQSYNGYLLSRMYVDYTNGGTFTKQQTSLIQQATSSDWFTQIASENLGIVLRQLLMYQSQLYVLMSQMLETQKQALTAQAMTNSLLILSNQQTENMLTARAKTMAPGG